MEPEPARAPGARWEELFDELVELTAADRARRFAEIERTDPTLAARLARMLEADGEATDFLARPAAELLGAGGDGSCLPAGTRVGSWRLLELLGRGGMGEVYLAERDEGTFTQRAALKLIKRGMDSRAIVRRFVRERQILSRLEHPGIARLLDGGSAEDGRPFFVLERVEGVPIDEYCRARGLGLEERLRLAQSVCATVDSAHHNLVVHRDLKPANILVTADSAVKLLDFGIAKLLSGGEEEEETAHLTQLGARVLTPAYAAPEQILGEPVTTATDVYALGVLLFELITGALPHAREQRSLSSLASGVERETAERPSGVLRRADTRLARRVSGDLDLIVLTAMHREPARRYASAAALADDLGRFLAGRPVRARADSGGYRLRKFVGRHRLPVAIAGLGLMALLIGLGMALWEAHAARLAAQRAERVKSFLLSVFQQWDPNQAGGAAVTARELLEKGTQRIDVELAGEPEIQAEVLDAVAGIEANLGLTDAALAHARKALTLREARLPRGDARIAESRALLGEMQRVHGDLGEARQTLEKALAETIATRGEDSLETANVRRSLAGSLQDPAGFRRGVELLRLALATIRRRLGDGSVEMAGTLSDLGIELEQAQQYEEAEKVYRQSLASFERLFGPHHPKVAVSQRDLAGLLDRLSRPDEARKLFEAAIATQRATLGPRHLDLANSLFSYGVLLQYQQEHQAADAAFNEALDIFGPDRFEAGHCLRYLGLSAMDEERYQDAAELFTRAAETYRRIWGKDDLQRWRAIANLGWAHLKLKQVPLARRELSEAVASVERLAGPESYELRMPLKELGQTLTEAGANDEAVATLQRERRLEEKLFGTIRHREVGGSDLLLAQALIARDGPADRQAARHTLDEALGIFSSVSPKELLNGETLLESGKLALADGDRARARRELAAAEPILLAHFPPTHESIREIHRLRAKAGR
ncbi:MAG TPA: serine/threonine-protein kinase [Thermoanaerobaculia bacterium]